MNVEPEKIHALINILQSMLVVDDQPEKQESQSPASTVKKTRKNREKTTTNIKSKKTKRVFVNKFDNMPEHKMHKEDVLIDKRLNVLPPTPRDRYFEPVQVQCRICGKTETVSPSLVDGQNRYKCNNCSTSSG
jgi:hypothetical protein